MQKIKTLKTTAKTKLKKTTNKTPSLFFKIIFCPPPRRVARALHSGRRGLLHGSADTLLRRRRLRAGKPREGGHWQVPSDAPVQRPVSKTQAAAAAGSQERVGRGTGEEDAARGDGGGGQEGRRVDVRAVPPRPQGCARQGEAGALARACHLLAK